MALVVLSRNFRTRLLCYCRNLAYLRSAAVDLRKYSGFENNEETNVKPIFQEEIIWPDELMGPLSPLNKKFPLPGNVGISSFNKALPISSTQTSSYEDMLEGGTNTDRQLNVVSQLIAESDYLDDNCEMFNENYNVADTIISGYFDGAAVELAIQDCPKILYKEFSSLFLEMPQTNITVITVTQKTHNDMASWSEEIEQERDELLSNFISTATEICQLLKANEFWCDFIDPSSGQAYFGPYTNSTLFETDDRYNSLGFKIDDLGCCKVITHKKWGSKAFVGSIVTTAKKDHPVMKNLLKIANG